MGRPATSIPHKEVICYCFFYLVFSFWANIQCKNLLVSTYASETRDFQFESAYLVFFKWANPGLFLFIFVLFNNNLQKNCRLQRESNLDRRNRRQAHWPLNNHHVWYMFGTLEQEFCAKCRKWENSWASHVVLILICIKLYFVGSSW